MGTGGASSYSYQLRHGRALFTGAQKDAVNDWIELIETTTASHTPRGGIIPVREREIMARRENLLYLLKSGDVYALANSNDFRVLVMKYFSGESPYKGYGIEQLITHALHGDFSTEKPMNISAAEHASNMDGIARLVRKVSSNGVPIEEITAALFYSDGLRARGIFRW